MQTLLLLPAWEILLISIAPLLTVALLMSRIRKFVQRRYIRRQLLNRNRCSCGYLMENLDVIRCPECGKIPGFDVTAEELGLSRE